MPQLLILRHAIAMDRDEADALSLSDFERPLTDKGRERMAQVASGIKRTIHEPALILSSPLLRARQTAEILAAQYDTVDMDIIEELSPGHSLHQLIAVLQKQQVAAPLVIVGHEPSLSTFAGLLLCGRPFSPLQLKKAGAALFEFNQRIDSGCGTLLWLMPPRLLRTYNLE
jgi:phosphohistidine phosphatase